MGFLGVDRALLGVRRAFRALGGSGAQGVLGLQRATTALSKGSGHIVVRSAKLLKALIGFNHPETLNPKPYKPQNF